MFIALFFKKMRKNKLERIDIDYPRLFLQRKSRQKEFTLPVFRDPLGLKTVAVLFSYWLQESRKKNQKRTHLKVFIVGLVE